MFDLSLSAIQSHYIICARKFNPLPFHFFHFSFIFSSAAGTSEEAVKDTAENLGLAMRVNGELYPVRMTAYKSLLDRAKIGGTDKNIAAAAEDPDDKLRDRMYDDIDRVIVFDNENLKIEWKFDVAT